MSARIIDRGRGPELEGTRVTVYRVMDYVVEGASARRIAHELNLSDEQVQAALEYIAAHRSEVDAEYERILKRVHGNNPAWVDAGSPKTAEELKQRIKARASRNLQHAGGRRQ
jgi:uncharacterized protein (DUF433 family)